MSFLSLFFFSRRRAGDRGRVLFVSGLCLLAVTATQSLAAAERQPNVIVILTDDLGYSDVGAQGVAADVQTPHLDRLAREGVRCTSGYVTAPQCSPSRAGLVTGRYQQRFGIDTIPDCPLPLEAVTLAERLHSVGYSCGMVGKWHLDPGPLSRKWARQHLPDVRTGPNGRLRIPPEVALEYFPHRQGFQHYFVGAQHRYFANIPLEEGDTPDSGKWIETRRFRVDVQSDAAVAFLKQTHEKPFFLYLSYYAPHVPLEATEKYLARFPGEMPERRRHALAMIAAVDDGVGRILSTLDERGLSRDTLIVFTSDNGAPLKLTKEDVPVEVSGATWDGSLNDPLTGEKGMLAEGGIRVPFLLRWPAVLPAGRVYERPVSTLDIAATAVAAAGLPHDSELDGVDLVPFLSGRRDDDPHQALYWRFWNQAAVREGNWKYLKASNQAEFLFDLAADPGERTNLLDRHGEVAGRLRRRLAEWSRDLIPAGLPETPLNNQEVNWYRHYFGVSKAEK